MNQLYDPPRPTKGPGGERPGSGWPMWLLAIPMVLCCGLPLIVTVLATASALTKGILVGVVVAVIGIAATLLVRRSIRNKADCCVPPGRSTPSPESQEVDHRR